MVTALQRAAYAGLTESNLLRVVLLNTPTCMALNGLVLFMILCAWSNNNLRLFKLIAVCHIGRFYIWRSSVLFQSTHGKCNLKELHGFGGRGVGGQINSLMQSLAKYRLIQGGSLHVSL